MCKRYKHNGKQIIIEYQKFAYHKAIQCMKNVSWNNLPIGICNTNRTELKSNLPDYVKLQAS